jgi:RNA polymerase sigma-70 factor (ECF subfamily)
MDRADMTDFAEFFAETRDGAFRTMLAATGNRHGAEDAIAEAYARAYANWSTVASHPNPTAWVLRTALNAHRSAWRRQRREVLAASLPESATGEHVEPGVDMAVRMAVRALPTRQREVVALRLVADLSAEETAGLLGLSSATVHVHLHRALATLRKWLDPDGPQGHVTRGQSTVDRSGLAEFAVLRWAVRCAF